MPVLSLPSIQPRRIRSYKSPLENLRPDNSFGSPGADSKFVQISQNALEGKWGGGGWGKRQMGGGWGMEGLTTAHVDLHKTHRTTNQANRRSLRGGDSSKRVGKTASWRHLPNYKAPRPPVYFLGLMTLGRALKFRGVFGGGGGMILGKKIKGVQFFFAALRADIS